LTAKLAKKEKEEGKADTDGKKAKKQRKGSDQSSVSSHIKD
jgi:hypothetical protein